MRKRNLIKFSKQNPEFEKLEWRKLLEEELSLGAEILDATTVSIFLVNLDGEIIYVNDTACAEYGYSKDELTGMNVSGILTPKYANLVKPRIEELLKKGELILESEHYRKDGSSFPVEVHSKVIKSRGNKYFTTTVRNITKHKRTEEYLQRHQEYLEVLVEKRTDDLQDANEKLRSDIMKRERLERDLLIAKERWEKSFENVGEGLFLLDRDFNILQCNNAFARLVNEKQGNLIGRKCYEIIHGIDHSPEYCISSAALNEGKSIEAETFEPFLGKYLNVAADPIIESDGNIRDVIHIVRDITERRWAEEALKESEKKYRVLIENLNEGVWRIDKDARTNFASDRMAEMLGYTVEEMMGKPLFSFMDEEEIKRAKELFEHRKRGISERHDFEFLKKNGSKICTSLATSPVTDNEGNFAGAIAGVIDITRRKRAEQQIERLSRQLLNEHEEARRKMATDLHDELGSTVNMIKLELEMLEKEMSGRSRNELKNRLDELNKLLVDALDTIRDLSGELRPTLLDDFGLAKALTFHIEKFSKNTNTPTTFQATGELVGFPKDIEISLFRIAQESLLNVQKHAEAKGVIVSLIKEMNSLILTVKDDGKGFNVDEVLEKNAGSYCFGLLEMRERTRMVEGQLEISSKLGSGTTVSVKVPIESNASGPD